MDQATKGGATIGPSANERFKDMWETRVAWSTVAAVAFHAVLVGFAGFHLVLPVLEPTTEGRIMVLATSLAGGSASAEQSAPTTLPDDDAAELEPTVGGGSAGSAETGAGNGDDVIDLWSAAAGRLGYGEGFLPEIVQPETEPPTTEEATESGTQPLDVRAAGSALAELADADSVDVEMDLDRLAAFRPELAVMLPSMWILLRNPREVETFFRQSYRRWRLDRERSGTVSVTVWIDTRGSVEWAEVSGSSGWQALDEAALALFNEVVLFRPARQEGVAVSGSATFALLFPW